MDVMTKDKKTGTTANEIVPLCTLSFLAEKLSKKYYIAQQPEYVSPKGQN